MTPSAPGKAPDAAIRVAFEQSPGQHRELEFRKHFVIGRAEECDVSVANDFVSRRHAEVDIQNGEWWIHDLGSRNGIFIDGVRAERAPIGTETVIRLGIEGPVLTFAPQTQNQEETPNPYRSTDPVVARYIDHYLTASADNSPAGEHTIMVRRAFSHFQAKQRRKYGWILAGLSALLLAIAGYSIAQYRQTRNQKDLARQLFYSMKSLDVEIASLERMVAGSSPQVSAEVRSYQKRRGEMEATYDRFLAALHVYDPKVTPQQRLILRVARIFGECELAAPPDFVTEVTSYIHKWQSSPRLSIAIRRARENGYTPVIARELLRHGLPPQFFYLALQESNFDPYASGPVTHKGIAKGMWQFVPETAAKYSLRVGPLFELRRPDPGDDRHHWDRATTAAALYIRDLYADDAQASGMLVMACYNWGEDRVLPLVRSMPANPRDRNFWKLLQFYRDRIPQETYDYVFYIVSAAVIGEDPRMFGFDFDNPLSHLESE